ncbi:unnamed protein product [Alopecurus aequalis]
MSSRKKLPGDLCPYSTYYDLASPLAPLIKDAKEQACIPTLAYAVRRSDTVLVGPASPTPRETKSLSDLDDIDVMRMHMSMALFYRGGGVDGVHPAGVIRRALAKALVHYYPLAGRLREIEGRKLVVDCTGEGVLFVQADADVQLADLEAAGPGHGLSPPFPCWDQLLFDVEGSGGLLNTPIMLIQVTRFLCGGFVVALRFSHTICDGIGISQFMNAVGELARGLPSMTVTPVWCRELIMHGAQPRGNSTPPRAGCTPTSGSVSSLPQHLRVTATTFEALAALIWRARTVALELPPGEDAPLGFPVNIRGAGVLSLPAGYYGNAMVPSITMVNSAALCSGSLGDAVALVRRAKDAVTTEYVRSMVDGMVMLGRRVLVPANLLGITDARRIGLDRVDLGLSEPVFAGPAEPLIFGLSYFVVVKDRNGVDAVSVPVVLPPRAMDRFVAEVERSLGA